MSWQLVADILRAVSIPVATITAAVSIRVAIDRRYRSVSQLFRFLGLAGLTSGLALGQYHALGRPAFWPALILLWLGLACSFLGTFPLATARMRSESLRSIDDPEGT